MDTEETDGRTVTRRQQRKIASGLKAEEKAAKKKIGKTRLSSKGTSPANRSYQNKSTTKTRSKPSTRNEPYPKPTSTDLEILRIQMDSRGKEILDRVIRSGRSSSRNGSNSLPSNPEGNALKKALDVDKEKEQSDDDVIDVMEYEERRGTEARIQDNEDYIPDETEDMGECKNGDNSSEGEEMSDREKGGNDVGMGHGESENEEEISLRPTANSRKRQFQHCEEDEERVEKRGSTDPGIGRSGEQSGNNSRVTEYRPSPQFDETVIVETVRSLNAELRRDAQSSNEALLNELKKERNSNLRMRDDVKFLSSIVTAIAGVVCKKQGVAGPKQKEIQKYLGILPFVFSDNIMVSVLGKCFIGFAIKEAHHGDTPTLENIGIELIRLMLFAKNPSETKKEKYSSELGLKYSKFRHGILLSSILALQKNSFKTFFTKRGHEMVKLADMKSNDSKEDFGKSGEDDQKQGATGEIYPSIFGTKQIQPPWLEPGYIGVEHCDEAARKAENIRDPDLSRTLSSSFPADNESTVGSQSSTVSEDPAKKTNAGIMNRTKLPKNVQVTPDLIACEAAGIVYRIITNILHKGRDACRIQLFHELLYPFTSWSQLQKDVNQKSLKLEWQKSESVDMGYYNDPPLMGEVSSLDRFNGAHRIIDEIDSLNMRTLEKYLSEHPEMTLVVEHDVVVSGRTVALRSYMNIMAVAAKLVSSFCTLENNSTVTDILGIHRSSMTVVTVVSLALRKLIDKSVKEVRERSNIPWLNCKTGKQKAIKNKKRVGQSLQGLSDPSYKFPEISGLSIDDLQPAPSKQKDILGPMLLHLKEAEFKAKHRPVGYSDDKSPVGDDTVVSEPLYRYKSNYTPTRYFVYNFVNECTC